MKVLLQRRSAVEDEYLKAKRLAILEITIAILCLRLPFFNSMRRKKIGKSINCVKTNMESVNCT